jgi:hypothetical protein
MKSFKEYNKINESSAEQDFLNNLYKFYSSKFVDDGFEEKFISVCMSLVDKSEISKKSLLKFLEEKGIEYSEPEADPVFGPDDIFDDGDDDDYGGDCGTHNHRGESHC